MDNKALPWYILFVLGFILRKETVDKLHTMLADSLLSKEELLQAIFMISHDLIDRWMKNKDLLPDTIVIDIASKDDFIHAARLAGYAINGDVIDVRATFSNATDM